MPLKPVLRCLRIVALSISVFMNRLNKIESSNFKYYRLSLFLKDPVF